MSKRKMVWKPDLSAQKVATCLAAIAALLLAASGSRAQAPANAAGPAVNVSAATTDANGYKVLTPLPSLLTNKTQEHNIKMAVNAVLKGNLPLADERARFDAYYQRHYFPLQTQTSDKALEELSAERHRFFRDHLEQCKDPEVHQHLVDMAYTEMKAIVQDNFHPAVRFNAMMIISHLNDSEPVRVGAAPALPQPMVRALPVILEEYKRTDGLQSVRVAALIGLARHLEWDNHRPSTAIGAPLKAEIIKTLIDTALLKDAPTGMTAEGHEWFRRRAIEALAHTGYTKAEPQVADALDKLLKDESESLPVRCSAAISIGRMVYAAPAKLDPQPTAKELGYLALLACHEELNRLATLKKTEEDRALRLSADGSGVTGGFGGGGGLGIGGAGGFSGGAGGLGGRMSRPPAGGAPSADSAMPGSMRGGPRPGAIPQGEGYAGDEGLLVEDPKQYRFDPARRRMRAQIHCVLVGLTGLEKPPPVSDKKVNLPAGATPLTQPVSQRGVKAVAKAVPDAKYVDDVINAVTKLAESIETSDVDVATLDKDVRRLMGPLERLTKKLPTAVVTPTDVPGADVPAAPGARAAAGAGAGARANTGAGGAAAAAPSTTKAAGSPDPAAPNATAPPAAAAATPPQSGATAPPPNATAPAAKGASNPAPDAAP